MAIGKISCLNCVGALLYWCLWIYIGTGSIVFMCWLSSCRESREVVWTPTEGNLLWLESNSEGCTVQVVTGWPNSQPLQWLEHGPDREKRPTILSIGERPPSFTSWSIPGFRAFRMVGVTRRLLDGRAIWEVPPEIDVRAVQLNDGEVETTPTPVVHHMYFISIWLLGSTFWLFPAAIIVHKTKAHLSKRYRRRHRLCSRCGYDLRETPIRCPECWTPRDDNRTLLKS